MKDVVVAIAGKKESYLIAEELIKENRLKSYITPVYYKKNSITCVFSFFFKGKKNIYKRILQRKKDNLTPYVIQKYELLGLLELVLTKWGILPVFLENLRWYLANRINIYAIKVAKRRHAKIVFLWGTKLSKKPFLYRDKHCPYIKICVFATGAFPKYIESICKMDMKKSDDNYVESLLVSECNSQNILNAYFVTQNADGFITTSSFVKRSIVNSGANIDKVKVLKYGVEKELFPSKKQYSNYVDGVVKFIFVGRVEPIKGIHHLLLAFSKLPANKCKLFIVGDYKKEDPYVKMFYRVHNIEFVGSIMHADLYKYYQMADVFVLPSISEGFGRVCMEAMQVGLPVILSENVGACDLVKEGENGFVVPVSDRQKLYESMMFFINNKEKIEIMGKKSSLIADSYVPFGNLTTELDMLFVD